MSINVSFADIEDRSPVRPGKHDVIIEQIEVGQKEGSEHPYLRWTLTISDGEFEGRKLTYITSLSPKSLWNLQNAFQSFGLEDEELEVLFDEETSIVTSPDLIGLAAIATVKAGMYEGRPTSKVISLQGEETPAPKKKAAKNGAKPAPAKAKTKPEPEEDEDEEETEEEEEEEEKKPAKKSTTKTAGKVSPFTKGKAGQRRRFS